MNFSKVFSTIAILFMSVSVSTKAFAVNSPEFSFSNAVKAFKGGKVPSAQDLVGTWIVVGAAVLEDLDGQNLFCSGYFADGNWNCAFASVEPFSQTWTFQSTTDVFQNPQVTVQQKAVTSSGFVLQEGNYALDACQCSIKDKYEQNEMRLTGAYLLVSSQYTHSEPSSPLAKYDGKPHSYWLLRRR